jgi:hypothetical protein
MPHPVEDGSGAPSFRPLWTLMPYLWPRDMRLRARVFLSIFCLVLAILATTAFPVFMGQVTNELARSCSPPPWPWWGPMSWPAS